jgi:aldose 1-epimerase
MTPSLASRTFGFLSNGEPVEAWTLRGSGGLTLEAITRGATVTRLLVPDSNGCVADVVLGFSSLDSYLNDHAYFGAVVGRVAGRIRGARFNLEGNDYEIAPNERPNHLHGGIRGFDKRIWTASPIEGPGGAPSLRLTYRSPDGEEGYPGTVDVAVTYTITHDNAFLIETEAVTDRPTPFSLTHHSYFNLAGEGTGTIADHKLQILADEFVFTDERMALLGRLGPVEGRGNDFRQLRSLGDAIPQLFQSHGDLYPIRKTAQECVQSEPVPAARLVHPASGRVLEVSTTNSHLQLYTGAALDGSVIGKSGFPYRRHAGVCLECQGYPDGANTPDMGDIVLRPGHPRCESTSYAFVSSPVLQEGSTIVRKEYAP